MKGKILIAAVICVAFLFTMTFNAFAVTKPVKPPVKVDLMVTDKDVVISPVKAELGKPIMVGIKLQNKSKMDLTKIKVVFEVKGPEVIKKEMVVEKIKAGVTHTSSFSCTPKKVGKYTVTVTVLKKTVKGAFEVVKKVVKPTVKPTKKPPVKPTPKPSPTK